ncbi:MAG: helix-turn-helix transcriptional regulator [Gemmatimonadetes bacterium]|nr:helix-turn-helix transcriptional regulator [Gemmatimonadota bacterium]
MRLPYAAFYGIVQTRARIRGFEVALRDADPHATVERHTHDEAHFVLVLGGLYVSSARGAPAVATAPMLVYNPPGTTHRDRFERHTPSAPVAGRFLAVSIAPRELDLAGEEAPLLDHAVAVPGAEGTRLATRLAAQLARGPALTVESLALELLELVTSKPDRSRRPPGWLERARTLLADRCGEEVTVGEVAREVGVHPVYFARAFHRFLGETPGDYLRRRRVERACALLTGTRRSLPDIAASAGFTDQSHMTRELKRATGATPGAVRGGTRSAADPTASVDRPVR